MMMAVVLLATAAAVASPSPAPPGTRPAPATVDAKAIPNYHRIRPGLAFAGQPTEQGLAQLKALGFKTVINLRLPIEKWTGHEAETVKAQGLRYVTVPVNPLTFGAEEVAAVRAVLEDPSAGPVLLHCASANRSAAVWGVIEVERGRSIEEVEAEAVKAGMTSGMMVEGFRRVARERAAARQMIRLATAADAPAAAAIYAPYVTGAVDLVRGRPPSTDEMASRIASTLGYAPFLVYEKDGEVLGFAYAARHRERAAYRWSVDVSVYVHERAHRRGVGRALYTSLFAILRLQGFYAAHAGITLPEPALGRLARGRRVRARRRVSVGRVQDGRLARRGWWQLALRDRTGEPRPAAVAGGGAGRGRSGRRRWRRGWSGCGVTERRVPCLPTGASVPFQRSIGGLGGVRIASHSPPPYCSPSRDGRRGPNTRSASYWLCRRQRSAMFSTVAGPFCAKGWTWWNSRNVRSVHLRPSGETKAHWPSSRRQTTRLTSRGMAREGGRCRGLLIRPGTDRSLRPRLRRRPELLLLDLREEHGQRAIDDRRGIAVGDLAPEERLQAAQLLARGLPIVNWIR